MIIPYVEIESFDRLQSRATRLQPISFVRLDVAKYNGYDARMMDRSKMVKGLVGVVSEEEKEKRKKKKWDDLTGFES